MQLNTKYIDIVSYRENKTNELTGYMDENIGSTGKTREDFVPGLFWCTWASIGKYHLTRFHIPVSPQTDQAL